MTRKPIIRKPKTARRIRTPERALRAKKPDAIAALVAASAQALALPLEPAWHVGVKFNLRLILRTCGAWSTSFRCPTMPSPRRCSVLETAARDLGWSTAADIAAAVAAGRFQRN
jgi:hypothetical protein